ncbi:type VII secretion system-associated protein [Streptomyces tsukubensis]|uniref:type VII secretion system-associated protein n=1 Tax=Streptomyces tsukubensis TaxID=83656 RepID=UPI0036762C49
MAQVDLSHLDIKTLEAFRDNDPGGVKEFVTKLAGLLSTDAARKPTSMVLMDRQLENQEASYAADMLWLGKLGAPPKGASTVLTAAPFLGYVKSSAKALHTVEKEQKTTFDNITRNLTRTIEAMKKAQQTVLEDVEAQRFLNDWRSIGKAPDPRPGPTP